MLGQTEVSAPPAATEVHPMYAQGWEHGYAAAHGDVVLQQPEPSSLTKVLAAGTFLGALGAVGVLVISRTPNHPLREVALVLGAAGLILAGTVGAVRVLDGHPTPKLGLKV